MGTFVLHLDVDSFFVQAEQLADPALQGQAVAVQQHQDIIAANAAAKAAGVTKHMQPAEARRLLRVVGGHVVHVHLAPGGRVSYQPYRELSARMLRLLRGLPWAAVVEKASIDEAYMLLEYEQATAGLAPSAGTAGVSPEAALQRAHEAKAAVLAALGLCVSVGVAPNRLLAKLASAAAKPDGVKLVAGQAAALQLLSQTPASRLPGYGGKAAEAFERHGVRAATDLQRFSRQQMEQLLGLKPAAAAQLAQWCRGLDTTPVQERGPPKSLSVQMSLTPQLLPMHPSQGRAVSAAGGAPGVLQPLVVGKPDFGRRVRQLMEAMGLDLLQRVAEDSAEEAGRWPRTLSASVRAFGAGRDQSYVTRSAAFPAHALAAEGQRWRRQQQQQGRQQAVQQQAEQQQQGRQQAVQQQAVQQQQQHQGQRGAEAWLGPLEEAVVRGLEALIHQAAAAYPAAAALTVVELRLVATNFQPAAAAAAALPITRFFAAAPRPGRQQAEQQQEQGRGGRQGQGREQQTHLEVASAAAQVQASERQQAAGPLPCEQRQRQRAGRDDWQGPPPGEGDAPELSNIDVQEQQRILQEIERRQRQAQPRSRDVGGATSGGGGKRQRKRSADASQPKISAFTKR